MLVFVDESGDLGYRFDRNSSRYFTIALVAFGGDEAALSCQKKLEALQSSLRMSPRNEFRFNSDNHKRRLEVLGTVANEDFRCYTFTLNKTSPSLTGPGLRDNKESGYKWVCRIALENMSEELHDASVVIDGSGDRTFRRQISTYLRQRLNVGGMQQIKRVKIGRSDGDVLLQLADYVAGITNRCYEGKSGYREYEALLQSKWSRRRLWP